MSKRRFEAQGRLVSDHVRCMAWHAIDETTARQLARTLNDMAQGWSEEKERVVEAAKVLVACKAQSFEVRLRDAVRALEASEKPKRFKLAAPNCVYDTETTRNYFSECHAEPLVDLLNSLAERAKCQCDGSQKP